VQLLLSSHGAVLFKKTQPVPGVQASVVHGLLSMQIAGAPPAQAPFEQVSAVVQGSLSSQEAALSMLWHPSCVSQVSVVHGLSSPQRRAAPALQIPAAHWSSSVQAFPSSHGALLNTAVHPTSESQASVVHALPSLQLEGLPLAQAPASQWSPTVQASPSSQAPVTGSWTQPWARSQRSLVHGFASAQPRAAPWHPFAPQVSRCVQRSPSSHAAPMSIG